MLLSDFCSYAEVRAALGVEEDELEDATLALPVYSNNLELELLDLSLTLVEQYKGLSLQQNMLLTARPAESKAPAQPIQ